MDYSREILKDKVISILPNDKPVEVYNETVKAEFYKTIDNDYNLVESVVTSLVLDNVLFDQGGMIQLTKKGYHIKTDIVNIGYVAEKKKEEKEELKQARELENIEASISIVRYTKIVGTLTIVCLVVQLALGIFQLNVSERQEQLQERQYKNELQKDSVVNYIKTIL